MRGKKEKNDVNKGTQAQQLQAHGPRTGTKRIFGGAHRGRHLRLAAAAILILI
jgi:hypothetical protein